MSQTQELSPQGSFERDEPQKDEKKTKSRRPPNTAFRQQRLKAWQPILTPKTVLPIFFAVGIIFAPLGGLMLWASSEVKEMIIDYSGCGTNAPLLPSPPSAIPSDKITTTFTNSTPPQYAPMWQRSTVNVPYGNPSANYTVPTNSCTISFYIPDEMGPPVYMYYQLTNFYQNHRRYVSSVNQQQMAGDFVDNATINENQAACSPLQLNGSDGDANRWAFYPCGLIANSLFNDTFFPPVQLNVAAAGADNRTYVMTNSSIAWSSDKGLYKQTSYTNDQVTPPLNWAKRYPYGYNDDFPIPNINEDEPFQVWMRTAGLPTFSKMALRNDTTAMPIGLYNMTVYDDFPVEEYGGTKSILLSTRTVLGGKNPYLGIAYIVVGGVCIVLGVLFTITHLVKPRKLGDHTLLTWNNDQPTAATTVTGRSV